MAQYNYNGIAPESLLLLSENRFRNDRSFYEENKEKIKNGIIVPMRQIAQALADDMLETDGLMSIDPSKMVSRIRRDTRFTKDKSLYRENIWMLFMREKHELPDFPAFWFEVRPDGYDCGVGTYATPPGMMECYREAIRKSPEKFLSAAAKCLEQGAVFGGEKYKKEKPGLPCEAVSEFYSVKTCWFIKRNPDITRLADESIIDEIRQTFTAYREMYAFLLGVSSKWHNP